MELERQCPDCRAIKLLDEELLALGKNATLLEELYGFVADLIACPS